MRSPSLVRGGWSLFDSLGMGKAKNQKGRETRGKQKDQSQEINICPDVTTYILRRKKQTNKGAKVVSSVLLVSPFVGGAVFGQEK